jgi:hypothetical protein
MPYQSSKPLSFFKTKNNALARGSIVYRPEDYNIIGQIHNDGLDYIFQNTFSANPNTTYEDIKNATVTFIQTRPEIDCSNANFTYFNTIDFKNTIYNSCNTSTLEQFISGKES